MSNGQRGLVREDRSPTGTAGAFDPGNGQSGGRLARKAPAQLRRRGRLVSKVSSTATGLRLLGWPDSHSTGTCYGQPLDLRADPGGASACPPTAQPGASTPRVLMAVEALLVVRQI